jgi:GR25 family glycosyltransferase involved in LPS biosynthesis
MLKTYVISLDYPTQLMESLPQQGLLPVWSPGVNGKALTKKEIEENTTPLCAKICTRPSIGIGMAHVNAWTSIVKNHDDYALIVEDDVFFVDDFNMQLTRALQHVPKDFDILYLGCFSCTNDTNILRMCGIVGGFSNVTDKHMSINNYIDKPIYVTGAHAYIVSKKGAQTLLKELSRIPTHIDGSIQLLIKSKKINVYVTNPRIVFQTSTMNTESPNVSKIHPIIFANYVLSFIYFHIYGFSITTMTFIFLILGILAAIFQKSIFLLTLAFLAFSIPDFIYGTDINSIIPHYVLFVAPSAIRQMINL